MPRRKKFTPTHTKCAICGEEAPSGSGCCPAFDDYSRVCRMHCYQCKAFRDEISQGMCTYNRHDEIKANPGHYMEVYEKLKDKTDDELLELWRTLRRKYSIKDLMFQPTARDYLKVIPKMLHRRQFLVPKFERVTKEIKLSNGKIIRAEEIRRIRV